MKKTIFIIALCIFITSCTTAKDTVPVQIIAEYIGTEINGFENLAEASEDYIKYCMKSELELYSEYIVLYPFAGNTYNEFGIFKVHKEDDIKRGIEEIRGYLAFKTENWDTRYMGSEFDKIKNAKVYSFGKYILYTILSPNDSKTANERFIYSLK